MLLTKIAIPLAFIAALFAGVLSPVQAQAPVMWFNIQGDHNDGASDTIEVDPTPVSVTGSTRIMRVRVSRSTPRKNWDGLPYRSFVAEVLFDCAENSARYTNMEYFMQPAWKGPSHATTRYVPSETRPMRFRDVTPNPTARIMKAACPANPVTSN